jgi:acetyl esterase/lipase
MNEAPYLEVARRINANLFEVSYHFCPEVSVTQQIEEVYASYRYATTQLGYKPVQILVAGDSAGGGLAASLLQRIRDEQKNG